MDIEPLSFNLLVFIPAIGLDWVAISINIALFFVLLLGSFFASSSEVAFFSLNKTESDSFREEDSPKGRKIWWMLSNHKHLIATVLITNNFVNIFAILTGTFVIHTFAEHFGLLKWQEILLSIGTISLLLLLIGEIIPKVYASRYKLKVIDMFYQPMYVLIKIYSPIIRFLIYITKFVDNKIKPKQENASIDDLRDAIEMMPEPTKDETDGRDILKGLLNFSNTTVERIIRERTKVAAVSIDMTFDDLIEFINENEFSRVPVYEENLDNIKGVLHIKDLLPLLENRGKKTDWQSLVRPALFVPESKRIDKLLEAFRARRTHLAIVVDEYGGTTGIVTLDDITDEIFGEISDEFDTEALPYQKLEENLFRVNAAMLLNDFIRVVDIDENVFEKLHKSENINSLGGLILLLNNRIPSVGETVICDLTDPGFEFTIESVSRNRIEWVKAKVLQNE